MNIKIQRLFSIFLALITFICIPTAKAIEPPSATTSSTTEHETALFKAQLNELLINFTITISAYQNGLMSEIEFKGKLREFTNKYLELTNYINNIEKILPNRNNIE